MHKYFRREEKEYSNQLKYYGELQADSNTGYLEHSLLQRTPGMLPLGEKAESIPCISSGFTLLPTTIVGENQ